MTKYQENLLDLFAMPGWKQLLEEWQEARDLLVSTAHILDTERDLWKRKGEIQKIDECLNYERLVKMQIDEELQHADDAF